jgi:hypothetical protein
VLLALSHPDPAAEIHYTLDGSAPGPEAPRYTGPLSIGAPTTVRATAFRVGFASSPMSSVELVADDAGPPPRPSTAAAR